MKKFLILIGALAFFIALPAIAATLTPGSQIQRTWNDVSGIGLRLLGTSSDTGLSASGKLIIGGTSFFQNNTTVRGFHVWEDSLRFYA